MSRFDVYPSPGAGSVGYVIDVQADLLDALDTRVVVPLLPVEIAPKAARGLNPTFVVDGQPHVMLTQFMAAVPARRLGVSTLSLKERSDDVIRALDVLLIGF